MDVRYSGLARRREAVWLLLRCYSRLAQWDEAMRIVRRIQTEFPDHPKSADLQLEIGYILTEMGQHAQAITYLQKVMEWAEGEDAAEARLDIGRAYQNTGEYGKAIHAFYQIAFYGADASTQWINSADFERARCHEQLTQTDIARRIYQRIIRREGGGSQWGRHAQGRMDLLPTAVDGDADDER